MRIVVDAWAPDYGSSQQADGAPDRSPPPVDVNVEVPAASWSPRAPDGVGALDDVAFVDGRRRVDARLWLVTEGGDSVAGVAGSFAAGIVRCNGDARIVHCDVRRAVFAPVVDGEPVPPLALDGDRFVYAHRAVPDPADTDTLVAALQDGMRALEVEAAAEAASDADLLVVDGPLRGGSDQRRAVGYVKTHHTAYLPPALVPTVAALQPGERTPLFLTQSRYGRWCWYLRLPCRADHPWAGIVRCELTSHLDLDDAVARADAITATLPRFASRSHRDPRAPQNLVPVGALERHLAHRMGDPVLLERRLRRAAAAAVGA